MNIKKNHIVEPNHGKRFLMDFRIPEGQKNLPLVIFVHGIKGFKGWGTWDLIGEEMASAGHIFVKFNFSHNGTTLENPTAFDDLESFGRNNYMLELADLNAVIDHCTTHEDIASAWDGKHIALIGHSRGGPICLIQAANDPRITQILTWASVATLDYAWQDSKSMADWKRNGVMYRVNSRTKQGMPLYYQLYQNFIDNKDHLDSKLAAEKLNIPWLILHGTSDEAVTHEAAKTLLAWGNTAKMDLIEGANHTFGGKHPFDAQELPAHSTALIQRTILFLTSSKQSQQ